MTDKIVKNCFRIGFITIILSLLYFLIFSAVTYPVIKFFSSHFFTGNTDGFLHIWNLWWIKKAITQLHTGIWYTNFLNFPHGVSLNGHTLNPFNGFLALFLSNYFSQIQSHNIIIIFTFVSAGVTAFWLAFYFSRSFWASFIGGFIYTFSSYHFSHAMGHMELISIEWIPLFVLFWFLLLKKPGIFSALGSALSLYLVFLCSHYYFIYSIIIAVIILIWFIVKTRGFILLNKNFYIPLSVFIIVFIVTSGPLIYSYFILLKNDVLMGSHIPEFNSLDLFGLIIPGGQWRFAEITKFYWSRLASDNISEDSVHIGISTVIVLVYLLFNRKKIKFPSLFLWLFIFIFFAVVSLGPVLHIQRLTIPLPLMPYVLLEKILPVLSGSGVPLRLTLIVYLSLSVLVAIGIKELAAGNTYEKILLLFVIILLFIEYLPKPISITKVAIPKYINTLKDLPDGAVIDGVSDRYQIMYNQTVHEKPMAFGYTSRVPISVWQKNNHLSELIRLRDYTALCRQYNFRYFLTDSVVDNYSASVKYDDGRIKIYDFFGEKNKCAG